MINGNECREKHRLIELKQPHSKKPIGQDHSRTSSRRTDTNNDLQNTVYQPQQVYKQIPDQSKNEFHFDEIRVPISIRVQLHETRKLNRTNTTLYASRFNL